MPIGAIIGGVASIGSTLLSSKSNSKAIKKASTAQQQSTDQQAALQTQARNENTANLSPFMARGNAAGGEINALLGLGGSASALGTQGLPTQQPFQAAPYGSSGALAGGGGFLPSTAATPQGIAQQAPAQSPAQAAASAYEIFKQSTGYTTRLAEGNRSLASNYFGGGVGQSGAAMKAALRYGQDYGSNEFGKYLGYLGNQQGVGLAGASALAGVSQNYANNMSNISQNGANVQGQAAIAGAQNNGALWSGLAGIAGQTAGALSSYRPQSPGVTPNLNAFAGYNFG